MSQLSFSTSVSALKAYSESLNSDARNMASVGAVAGRPFSTLIHFSDATAGISSVGAKTTRNLSVVGQAIESGVAQNFSITGQGLAVVSDSTSGIGNIGFTKDCTFSLDKNKNLVNSTGSFLQGWLVNQSTGKIDTETVGSLAPLSFKGVRQDAKATTELSLRTHLNSTDAVDSNYKQTISVYDPTGNIRNLELTWTKTDSTTPYTRGDATQSWTLKVTDPAETSTIEGIYASGMRVEFNAKGQPVKFNTQAGGSAADTSPALEIDWGGGLGKTTVNLNLGSVVSDTNVINAAFPSETIEFDANGNPPGTFKDVTFDKTGNVVVSFSNGNKVNYARIPLAVFENINALQEETPGFFTSTTKAGNFTLQSPGAGIAGSIVAGTYEGSTTDGTATYVNLIQNYRNLSGNFKPIEIIQKVYDDMRNL